MEIKNNNNEIMEDTLKNARINQDMEMIKKGVDKLIGEDDIISKLKRNKKMIIKLGLDPTAPDIHLGHTVVLRKIRQLQDMGHDAVIIIGDFTARIGDPSGKSKTRPSLSKEDVENNARTYFEQVFKVIDKEKTTIRYNSEWLSKLNMEDILKLTSTTTVARMLERDDFDNRFKNETPIGIHEFLYPLLQAHDSVEIKADIEIGGTDQTFNILMGRTLQKTLGEEVQGAIFMPLLEGLDGVEKMSKSLGNYIGVDEKAEVMFKKVMEVKDELIIRYFELVTDESPKTINEIKDELKNGTNPRDIKLRLARTITSLYHGEEDVKLAEKFYIEAFSNKGIPENIEEISIINGELNTLMEELVAQKLLPSKSEFRRLLKQGGVKVNNEQIDEVYKLSNNDIVKVGKKLFRKINIV